VPLWSPEQGNFPNNQQFVKEFVCDLVRKSFPNLSATQIEQFVMGLFTHNSNLNDFKTHLRDFFVALKEFNTEGGDDNNELFGEETEQRRTQALEQDKQRLLQVPGLMYQGPSATHVINDDGDEDL
jgi:exportin-1